MTSAELQSLRDALYTQYLAWVNNGCPQSWSMDGRSRTYVTADFWLKQINDLDAQLSRLTNGGFFVAQFREPE